MGLARQTLLGMQFVLRSAAVVRHSRNISSAAIEQISSRARTVFGLSWWVRTLCDSAQPLHPHHRLHQGVDEKESLALNNNLESGDPAALLRSFEQWMAEYGKVYPTAAKKSRRFQSFCRTVDQLEYFNETYGQGLCVLNEFAAESLSEYFSRCSGGFTISRRALGKF
ncbi:hypothetical protein MLD38_003709 [Melastoma candidum]|uniref:Uncharacterized protein n=1 Tax=Melastoma candidum TaxID=119954 RepID=A0ACB9S7B5_9MYRT|nr:hypothetical protein MLD38_003709 [Melastoma candidum]